MLIWSIVFIFFACEIGEMLSNEFNTINDEFYRCRWYLLPAQMRRVFWMILANTQQPVVIEGYGNVSCMRETFKKVGAGVFIA